MTLEEYKDGIAKAVELDHPDCDNTCCDISAALRSGFPLSAGQLLRGATETPNLDVFITASPIVIGKLRETLDNNGFADIQNDDWEGWTKWFKANTVQCPHCDAFNFTDQGEVYTCGNCAKPLKGS